MRRRRIAVLLVLVALLGGALVWWTTRPTPRAPAASTGPDPWATEDTTALLAKKRATRGDAPVDERPASLSGFVRRKADGAAVPGAVVTVNPRVFGGAFFPATTDEPIVVVTDAAGAWQAPVVRPGTHVVSAAAAELLPASADVDLTPGVARDDVVLLLDAGGAELTGTVEDIGGGGIADARVTVIGGGLESLRSSRAYVAITGADGRYRLRLPDGSWQATARHADYTDHERDLVVRGQPVTADFTLTPGGTIRGQVIARDTGEPVAGARVSARGGRGGRGDDLGSGGQATDAGGHFTLRGVGSGAVELRASGRGYATREPTTVELGIGEELSGVRVVVDRAYTVSGFVVREGSGGEGVAGVRVGIFSIGQETAALALAPSAPDGYFEIVGVQPGNYLLAALGEGVMPSIGQPVAVVDADLENVLVQVNAGATLSGRVEPGAVARLSLQIDPSKIGIGNMFDVAKAALVHGASDATGAFTLRNVPAGTFSIVAQAQDGRTGTLPVTVTAADQRDLIVPLEPRAAISGRVVDPRGGAVAGVTVQAFQDSAGMALDLGDGLDESVTAADGSFRVAGLAPGETRLSVRDDQGPLAWADPDDAAHRVTLTGSEEVRDVTLAVEARDGVIRGVVLGADRQPVPDAWITARPMTSPWRAQMREMAERAARDRDGGDGGSVTVRVRDDDDALAEGERVDDDDPGEAGFGAGKTVLSGADGRFTITDLRRGGYHVVAEATKGALRAQQSGVQTGSAVTLILEPLGALTVTVTQHGAPVPAYDLHCDGPADDTRRRVQAADGTTVIERRAPGTYRCTARTDAGSASGTIQLAGAGRLALAVAGWASVTGVVVDAAGQPRAGLHVAAFGEGGDMGGAMTQMLTGGGPRTDAAGRFTLGELAAGKTTLIVFDAQGGFSPLVTRSITLTAGERHDAGTLTATPPGPRDAGVMGGDARGG